MQSNNYILRRHQRFITILAILPVALLLFAWLIYTPTGFLGKADAIGYAVCHRIDLRSFHLGERQLPLCARCSGMYLGAMLGLVLQVVFAPRRIGSPPKRVILVLGFFLVAFTMDGINSFLNIFPGAPQLYEPNNTLRLLTGTGMGLVIAAALYPTFNASVWRQADARPAIDSLKSMGLITGAALILDLVILFENPLILYPLALISAGGVIVILTMVYTLLWLVVLKRENRYNGIKELLIPLIGGAGLAIIQIALLDWLRYLITGSWNGFHIG